MSALRSSSFFMPAEWTRHARTILAWPGLRNPSFLDRNSLATATEEVSCIADAVARFEPVTLLVGKERLGEAQRRFVGVSGSKHQIHLHPVLGDEMNLWMRDIAPTFVVNKTSGDSRFGKPVLHGIDFNFNGWGNRHPTATCTSLAHKLLQETQTDRVQASIVTEGGALEIDGEGTLLVTESSIVNDNRNPGISREDIEIELMRCLGISKVLWLPGVKNADSTDCHIDALARFVRPGTVVLSRPTGPRETVWMRVYEEARHILSTASDAQGRSIEIIDVPEPDLSLLDLDEETRQAVESATEWSPVMSYVNYYLPNRGLIVPQFGDEKADVAAVDILRRVFGLTRDIVAVYINELPLQGGGIHCATQQVPATEA